MKIKLNITNAAELLGVSDKELTKYLVLEKWITDESNFIFSKTWAIGVRGRDLMKERLSISNGKMVKEISIGKEGLSVINIFNSRREK